jgi:hypothetical protein
VERFTRQPGRVHAAAVVSGAVRLSEVLKRAQAEGAHVIGEQRAPAPA